jgi:hypothetical protein
VGTYAVRLDLPFLRRSGTGLIPTSALPGCMAGKTIRIAEGFSRFQSPRDGLETRLNSPR